MPHASPFSSSVIWSTEEHLMRGVNHEGPHYAVFSSIIYESNSVSKHNNLTLE
jgi:hypothetical protein